MPNRKINHESGREERRDMFEELNYAELEIWREELLQEASGKKVNDPTINETMKWVRAISIEMEARERETASRIRFLVCGVNAIVLATIIFVTTGCQTVKGVTGDAGWILTKVSENIKVEQEK